MWATLIRHSDGSVTLGGKPQPDLREPWPGVAPITLEDGYTACCAAADERLGHSLFVYDPSHDGLYGFGIARIGLYLFNQGGCIFIDRKIPPPEARKKGTDRI